jgi:Magnesium chelatase, subunit ChlI
MTHEETQDIKAAVERAVRQDQHLWVEAPAGAGATVLARYYHALQQPLEPGVAADVDLDYRSSGLEPPTGVPFRAPHYTVSVPGMLGTAHRLGELQLAQAGVLCLSDVVEFRQALVGAIGRTLPLTSNAPQLVATVMPCPCGKGGWLGAQSGSIACSCGSDDRERFARRVERTKALLPIDWVTVRFGDRLELDLVHEMQSATA